MQPLVRAPLASAAGALAMSDRSRHRLPAEEVPPWSLLSCSPTGSATRPRCGWHFIGPKFFRAGYLGLEKFSPALSFVITFGLLAASVVWSLVKTRSGPLPSAWVQPPNRRLPESRGPREPMTANLVPRE